MFIDYVVANDCLNPFDSYGEICTKCNSCGRWNKETMLNDRLEVYKRHLQEEYEFDNWIEGFEETQRANIQSNIEYLQGLIKETEEVISLGESHD
jgi:hypothetical protein